MKVFKLCAPSDQKDYINTVIHGQLKTGMPAKKWCVGGGILIIVPGVCGIGIVSPPLDKNRQ